MALQKKTWFFRIDFKIGARSARYLFFFASPSHAMRSLGVDVTLHLSREEPAGSFHYEFLDQITAPNVPNIVEIGYNPEAEAFVVRGVDSRVREEKVDSFCRLFIQEVVEKNFGGQQCHASEPLRPGNGERLTWHRCLPPVAVKLVRDTVSRAYSSLVVLSGKTSGMETATLIFL